MWKTLREWAIAGVGFCVIAGALYLASPSASSDGNAATQIKATPGTEAVSQARQTASGERAERATIGASYRRCARAARRPEVHRRAS